MTTYPEIMEWNRNKVRETGGIFHKYGKSRKYEYNKQVYLSENCVDCDLNFYFRARLGQYFEAYHRLDQCC